MVKNGRHDCVSLVQNRDQVKIFRIDGAMGQHGVFPPLDETAPEIRSHQNDGHAPGFPRLDKRQAFSQLV